MNTPTAAILTGPVWGEPVKLTKEQVLQKWMDKATALAKMKDEEMELRKQVVAAFPFPADTKEGTQYADLNAGWRLKVVLKQNYKLSKTDTDAALNAYENAEGISDEEKGARKLLTERLVKWEPSLSISEYRKLDEKALAAIAPVLTISDGAPSLELVEPKK